MAMRQGAAAASAMERSGDARGLVVVYASPEIGFASRHEAVARDGLARRLAALKGFGFAETYDPAVRYDAPLYFVPCDTLIGPAAAALGVHDEHDLFGGVAPHPFVPTKAITHPLADFQAYAPAGWSSRFSLCVRGAVPEGVTAFTIADARRAGRRLLRQGAVRVKPVRAAGGRGQLVAASASALDHALEGMDPAELAVFGLVLEENLTEVVTWSVGQVRVADLVASYYGRQSLTPDNSGVMVYGGSDLTVVRGGFEALLEHDPPPEARRAVAQARLYDVAANACFPGLFASRRNYDVAQGWTEQGVWRSGVLEQSWRAGGASCAEIAALEVFRAEPDVDVARAACFEVYGDAGTLPPGAALSYCGVDEGVGPITKYTVCEPYDRASSR